MPWACRRGRDFRWSDPDGLALHDPSVAQGWPGLLLVRRDLGSRLRDHEISLFWTVLVGRELHVPDHWDPGDEYRWVNASASYVLRPER